MKVRLMISLMISYLLKLSTIYISRLLQAR